MRFVTFSSALATTLDLAIRETPENRAPTPSPPSRKSEHFARHSHQEDERTEHDGRETDEAVDHQDSAVKRDAQPKQCMAGFPGGDNGCSKEEFENDGAPRNQHYALADEQWAKQRENPAARPDQRVG